MMCILNQSLNSFHNRKYLSSCFGKYEHIYEENYLCMHKNIMKNNKKKKKKKKKKTEKRMKYTLSGFYQIVTLLFYDNPM